jgi:hypothetical protein
MAAFSHLLLCSTANMIEKNSAKQGQGYLGVDV